MRATSAFGTKLPIWNVRSPVTIKCRADLEQAALNKLGPDALQVEINADVSRLRLPAGPMPVHERWCRRDALDDLHLTHQTSHMAFLQQAIAVN
jgi:hypothetical protein